MCTEQEVANQFFRHKLSCLVETRIESIPRSSIGLVAKYICSSYLKTILKGTLA